jgi:predicted permease
MMDNFRAALRGLRRAPAVTAIAVASLALGIGANAAIFSIFNRAMLRQLPVAVPGQLVTFTSPGPKMGRVSSSNAGGNEAVFTYPMFRDLDRLQTAFTGIAAHREFSANVAYGGRTSSELGFLVSGSYFPVLGVRPALGRLLGPADDRISDAQRVAVLSYGYWQSRFGANEAALNDTLIVNGESLTIVGVAPRGFAGTTPDNPGFFVPLAMAATLHTPWDADSEGRKDYWLYLFARLKPGVARDTAAAAINGPYSAIVNDVEAPLQGDMSPRALEEFRNRRIILGDGARGERPNRGEMAPVFLMLFSIAGIVVLIACANIANLLVVRGVGRAGEFAVRFSLGARRSQLIAQLMMESLVLAVLGGLAGLLVMRWALDFLGIILPAEGESFLQPGVDAQLVLLVAGLSVVTALLIGLLPALHTTRVPVIATLKTQAGGQSRSTTTGFFRSALATAQISLALALVVVAGLFARSLVNIGRINLGMDVQRVSTFRISPELNGYPAQRSKALFESVEDQLAALPGVTSVSTSTVPFLAGHNDTSNVTVQGFEAGADTDTDASNSRIGPGFFRTLGIPLISGREFARTDVSGAQRVAIVNEAFARKFNLGRDAVGKRMQLGRSNKPNLNIEIVGLVQDAKYSQVKDDVPPQFFLPYRQAANIGRITFYLRSSLDSEQILAAIPRVVAGMDPNLPVERLRMMDQEIRERTTLERVVSQLSAAFALLATLLAAIGLYGVLAYTVAQRTPEIGVRMALGADPGRIRRMVFSQIGRLAVVGVAAELVAAVGLGNLAGSLLFGLTGTDPMVIAAAVIGVVAIAFVAGAIPAHRASTIEPTRALRWE